MIVRQNKGIEQNESFPNTNWYENQPENYVVDETTEDGKLLVTKIKSLYPYYNFILGEGKLVDVEAYTPTSQELETNKPPKTREEIQAETITALSVENADLKARIGDIELSLAELFTI